MDFSASPFRCRFTWFVGSVGLYAFLAAAVAFIGTQSKIRCFLTLNVLMNLVLLLAEAGPFVLDALNIDWETELPEDPTHELDKVLQRSSCLLHSCNRCPIGICSTQLLPHPPPALNGVSKGITLQLLLLADEGPAAEELDAGVVVVCHHCSPAGVRTT